MAAGKDFPLSITIATIDKSSATLRAIDAKFAGLSKRLGDIGAKAAKIGKSMTANLTLPIVAAGTAGVKAFADFEQGMSDVSTLIDTNTESLDDMGKKVLEIGRRTPVAIGEMTSALFDIRSASIPAANAMNVLERSAQLGVAGLGSTAQAARLAAGAINAWGLEGEAADKIFNTIFQTTKNGITTIAGLEQGFGSVAKKMADAGIEVDDYLASVAALTTTTLKASEAHTQMKAAVDGLEKSGKKTRKVFRKLGVKDFKELVEQTGSVTEAFRAVKGAAGNQSGALKDLIGSSEGAAAVSALVGSQGDKQIATLADMRKETEGLTDVQVAFNKQNATTAARLKRTKNQATSAAISLGKVLIPVVAKLTSGLQAASEWFENLDDDTKETIVTIAGVVAVVGPALIIFGKLATAVAAVTSAVRIMSVALLANPIVAIGAAIALAAVLIIKDWELFEEFFSLLWDAVTQSFTDAWDVISDIIGNVRDAIVEIGEAPGKIADALTGGSAGDLMGAAREQLAAGGGKSLFGLGNAVTTSMGAPAIPGRAVESGFEPGGGTSKIEVEFKNAPAGLRVSTSSDEREFEVGVGHQL